ncbi:MAG TPA: galactose oxidase, partial [Bacillota bacterium]|nr:galactose oxidase [Bacillota bacterium]
KCQKRFFYGPIYYAIVEEYNPATDTWTTKTPMSAAKSGCAAVVVDGKVYVIGGTNSGGYLSSVEQLTP